jgi:hypothetical protein
MRPALFFAQARPVFYFASDFGLVFALATDRFVNDIGCDSDALFDLFLFDALGDGGRRCGHLRFFLFLGGDHRLDGRMAAGTAIMPARGAWVPSARACTRGEGHAVCSPGISLLPGILCG